MEFLVHSDHISHPTDFKILTVQGRDLFLSFSAQKFAFTLWYLILMFLHNSPELGTRVYCFVNKWLKNGFLTWKLCQDFSPAWHHTLFLCLSWNKIKIGNVHPLEKQQLISQHSLQHFLIFILDAISLTQPRDICVPYSTTYLLQPGDETQPLQSGWRQIFPEPLVKALAHPKESIFLQKSQLSTVTARLLRAAVGWADTCQQAECHFWPW